MRKLLIVFPLYLLIQVQSIHGILADLKFMTHALETNRTFIDKINVAVTNFGEEKHYKMFEEAYMHDFNSNVYFLAANYVKSHEELLNSQKILRDLYLDILKNRYEVDAENLLKMSAPLIMLAKDKNAQYYLKKGYRHMSKAKEYRVKGYHFNRFLYSSKIKLYMAGMNQIKLAKKYAILALIESKIPIISKSDYTTQSLDVAKGLKVKESIKKYHKLRFAIINNVERGNLDKNYPYLLHHADNYGRIYGLKIPALTRILNKQRKKAESTFKEKKDTEDDDVESKETPDEVNGTDDIPPENTEINPQ